MVSADFSARWIRIEFGIVAPLARDRSWEDRLYTLKDSVFCSTRREDEGVPCQGLKLRSVIPGKYAGSIRRHVPRGTFGRLKIKARNAGKLLHL